MIDKDEYFSKLCGLIDDPCGIDKFTIEERALLNSIILARNLPNDIKQVFLVFQNEKFISNPDLESIAIQIVSMITNG